MTELKIIIATGKKFYHIQKNVLKNHFTYYFSFLCRCGKPFSTLHRLKSHIASVHEGIKKHQCEKCNKFFSELKGLRLHIQTIHEGIKAYKCDRCGKSFTDRSNCYHHKKKCNGQLSSQNNITALPSKIQFIDCGETIKQEIKEESDIEINAVDCLTLNSVLF